MEQKDVIIYIEKIRKEQNLSLKDFCSNICSKRNYRRYLTNVLELPFKIFTKLLIKYVN